MDNLRLILLLIGCLIIFFIYIGGVLAVKKSKKRAAILDAVDELPDSDTLLIRANNTVEDDCSRETLLEIADLLTQSRDQADDDPVDSKPWQTSGEEKNAIPTDDEFWLSELAVETHQSDLEEKEQTIILAATEGELEHKVDPAFLDDDEQERVLQADEESGQDKDDIEESNKSSETVLVLYITASAHILFDGLSIRSAADEVGMVYGQMNIFHHFGQGAFQSKDPLFSLANMYEPGLFEPGNMSELKTKGLAVFMYSANAVDAEEVFKLFLTATERLAVLLGGTVRTVDNKPLSDDAVQLLKEKAKVLTNNPFR